MPYNLTPRQWAISKHLLNKGTWGTFADIQQEIAKSGEVASVGNLYITLKGMVHRGLLYEHNYTSPQGKKAWYWKIRAIATTREPGGPGAPSGEPTDADVAAEMEIDRLLKEEHDAQVARMEAALAKEAEEVVKAKADVGLRFGKSELLNGGERK